MRMLNFILIFLVCCANLSAQNTNHYPLHSWDKLPVCMHLSKGNGSEDFNAEELKFISRFPIICIEKDQAHRIHNGGEMGTLYAAKAIKELNPETKVLAYLNCAIDYGDMYSFGYVLSDDSHPDWAIKNINDEFVLIRNRPNRRMFDPSNADMRKWWVTLGDTWTRDNALDGVFIDAVPKYAALPEQREKSWGKERYREIYDGLHTMLDSLKTVYNGERIMVANFLRGNTAQMEDMGAHFHDYTDGGMLEHFCFMSGSTKENIANDIFLIEDAGRRGKICIVKGWPSFNFLSMGDAKNLNQSEKEKLAQKDITFPLACFMIAAQKYSYFCYSWSYKHDGGSLVDYDEYNKPLGEPKGMAVKDGWIYTREFEHASVWVDIEKKQSKITWK